MHILEEELQRIFHTTNWREHTNNNILDGVDEIKITYNKQKKQYEIEAIVIHHEYTNKVTVVLKKDGTVPLYHCTCPYYQYGYRDDCMHTLFTFEKLCELEPTHFPFYLNFQSERQQAFERWMESQMVQKSKEFISHFATHDEYKFQAALKLDKIRLYAYASFEHGKISLSYKIGANKLYVVKNMYMLLHDIKRCAHVSYGKNLAFYHHIESFDDIAQAQIHFLQQYVKEHSKQFDPSVKSCKTITLDQDSLDAFYDLYSGEAIDCIDMRFGKDEIAQIPLTIQQSDALYSIQVPYDKEQLMCGEKYWYYLKKTKLHRFQQPIKTYCNPILLQLREDNQMLIHKDDMHDFCKYIVPTIQTYTRFNGASIDCFMPKPMYIKSYIDIEDNGDISIHITYNYEDAPAQFAICEQVDDHLALTRILAFIKQWATLLDYDKHMAYISEDAVHAPSFLTDGLLSLNDLSEVFVSDAVKQIHTPKKAHMQVCVRIHNNLIDMDVSSIHIPKDEIQRVLYSYRKRKKYHRLKNGDVLSLQGEELAELDTLLHDIHLQPSELVDGTASIPNYNSFMIEHFAKEATFTKVQRSDQFQLMMDNISTIHPQSHTIPNAYVDILRDYQRFGFQWLKTMNIYGFGGILADDMGLGKTLQIIALIEDEIQDQQSALVICPASLLFNWEDEVAKFSNSLTCLCIHGDAPTRMQQIKDIPSYNIVITSYDYIRRDYEAYANIHFEFIILDEAQYIKNHTSKNAFAVKQLKGAHRFALTGTPIENSLAELWSIFDFLMPNYLYNYHYFRSHFEKEIIKNKNESMQLKLKKMVEPFILRRIKKDVLTELPEKVESIYYQEFNEEEKKIYYANLMQINKDLQKKMQMEQVDKFIVLAMMTRLRQICCDSRLLYENVHTNSSKLQGCMDILISAKATHKKVLLFSSFTSMLSLIETELIKENIRYLKLTGDTQTKHRRGLVEKFQEEDYDVFLISLKAGGTGLNLTAAEIVIHYDPWWNMSAQNQATDRAYRIGQTSNVQVYKLIMKDSIEEKILKLQQRKMNLSDTFIAGNEGSITSMSNEEIMDLFR